MVALQFTKDTVFPPRKPAEKKQDITDAVARRIIAAETAEREGKTARLRKQRLAREAQEAAEIAAGIQPPRRRARKR